MTPDLSPLQRAEYELRELRTRIADLEAQLAQKDQNLEIALGALADVAKSSDMTLALMRKKALRIYQELRAIDPPSSSAGDA